MSSPQESPTEILFGYILDRVSERLIQEGNLGFVSESARKASMFGTIHAQQERWSSALECLFPGCSEPTVRSHTLSRSGPLDCIAEDGHVVTPWVEQGSGRLTVKRIGLGTASTFPGFCRTHEQRFSAFERAHRFESEFDHYLQFFRVACREVRIKLERQRHAPLVLQSIEEAITRRGEALLREEVARFGGIFTGKVAKFTVASLSARLEPLREEIQNVSDDLEMFRRDFFLPLGEVVAAGRNVAPDFATKIFVLPNALPVAIAGRGNFDCDVGSVPPAVETRRGGTSMTSTLHV
jgi:hypothetical protein